MDILENDISAFYHVLFIAAIVRAECVDDRSFPLLFLLFILIVCYSLIAAYYHFTKVFKSPKLDDSMGDMNDNFLFSIMMVSISSSYYLPKKKIIMEINDLSFSYSDSWP